MSSSLINPMKPFNPHGLKALLVDQNATSLFLLSKMLKICHYQVTPCSQPTEALSLIRNDESKFDIVITEVTFISDFNGIEFLDIIVRETDLPVVIVSADDRNDTIMKCVTKGACVYLPKPVRMEVFKLLWQHVARKEMFSFGPTITHIDNVESGELDSSNSGVDKEFCGSSDEQDKSGCKRQRLVWTDELHQKFVEAVKQLGVNHAVPKRILELMNVPGLKRDNVASHLQKYRLNLRKLTAHMQESFQVPNSSTGFPIQNELNVRTPPIAEVQSQHPTNHCDIHPIIFPVHKQDFHFDLHDEA